MRRNGRTVALVGTVALAAAVMAGCSSKSDSTEGATIIDVVSTDDSCTVSQTTAPGGKVAFAVRNAGTKVTEFYLYGADGKTIIGEVENIGPGVSRTMTATPDAGTYITACKPGETGDGIRAEFSVG